MADDSELEKRAIEELLRDTSRARLRAETMGPSGWMKCPLRSTNKRFLLNTLRSTALQRRTGAPAAGRSATRGRPRDETLCQDERHSSGSPRDDRDRKGHQGHRPSLISNHNDKRRDHRNSPKEKANRDERPTKHCPNRDTETHRLHSEHSPRSHSSPRESCGSHHSGSGHAQWRDRPSDRPRSRSPVTGAHSRRSPN